RQHGPGGGHPVGDLGLGHVHLDHGDLAGAEGDRLEQRGAAGHRGGGGPAQFPYGGYVLGGGALPPDVEGLLVAAEGHVDGHRGVRTGGGDDPFELVAVGGDGQGRGDGGGLPLGPGEGAVAGQFPDDQAEGYGEGEDDHRGHRQRHLHQGPSHRGGSAPGVPSDGRAAAGGSSFTPTPRRVCR